MVAEYYESFRQKLNRNLHGEKPLMPTCAATVLRHIRRHHQDPQVKQVVILEELQELREEIIKNNVMERQIKKPRDGRGKSKRGNKTQIDLLERVVKLELLVQSKDPAKMAFYSADARIDSTIHRGPWRRI